MSEVPKPALYIGLAGVIPYVATSLSTVYCAYEVHRAHEVGSGLILDEKTAELLLHILEPLQVGYGATVCLLKAQRSIMTSTNFLSDHLLPRRHSLGS